jgi:hypothetical protein
MAECQPVYVEETIIQIGDQGTASQTLLLNGILCIDDDLGTIEITFPDAPPKEQQHRLPEDPVGTIPDPIRIPGNTAKPLRRK